MFRKVLIAAAIVIASPAFVSAQDIFWSFDSTALVITSNATAGDSGSAYIFSDGLFGFDAIDLDFSASDSSVVLLTGGEAFNPTFTTIGGEKFNSSVITIDSAINVGNLFAINASRNGVDPFLGPLFDPGFDAGVGPNGAVLLARVDFDFVGAGSADLDFNLGPQGAFQFPNSLFDPSFGSASLTVASVPEPTSVALLILGSVGLVARRKRA